MNKAQFKEVYEQVCKAVDPYKDLYVLAGLNKDITILYPDHLTAVHVKNILEVTLQDYDHKIIDNLSIGKFVITFN